jgi:ATP-binding cassette subfamily F protein uup
MSLVAGNDLHIGFRGPMVLDGVSFRIEPGERIGLLGRNGSGKTTLLRILAGQVELDGGDLAFAPGTRVALLPQDVPAGLAGSNRAIVRAGILSGEGLGDPEADQRVDQILSRMQLEGEPAFDTLSTGMQRRVLLARALVAAPDLLLLDEPTNHLDIEAITWLEEFLAARWQGAIVLVTHDRAFLRKLAGRIFELDRGRMFDWTCDYDQFLVRKEAALLALAREDELFDRKLAEEEVWIRKGILARRTRNPGRVKALERMREQRRSRQPEIGRAQLRIADGERSGELVIEAEDIAFAHPGKPIFSSFSTTVLRRDRIGIVGPNGAGKTTLLKVLLGQLEPTEGRLRHGTRLQIAYFDQLREQLDEDRTVQDNIADGATQLRIGDRDRHVIGYLQEFLFAPDRARTLVRDLSGGERNRLLLARLFTRPANLIVLDEPTNDLDAETLELLEERLAEFPGTVLLVSHDRAFLDNVTTSLFVFEEDGLREFAGSLEEWQRQREEQRSAEARATRTEPSAAAANRAPTRKLTWNEQKELERLPLSIEELEGRIGEFHEAMAQADYYRQEGEVIATAQRRLEELETELRTTYARWEELESRGS